MTANLSLPASISPFDVTYEPECNRSDKCENGPVDRHHPFHCPASAGPQVDRVWATSTVAARVVVEFTNPGCTVLSITPADVSLDAA